MLAEGAVRGELPAGPEVSQLSAARGLPASCTATFSPRAEPQGAKVAGQDARCAAPEDTNAEAPPLQYSKRRAG